MNGIQFPPPIGRTRSVMQAPNVAANPHAPGANDIFAFNDVFSSRQRGKNGLVARTWGPAPPPNSGTAAALVRAQEESHNRAPDAPPIAMSQSYADIADLLEGDRAYKSAVRRFTAPTVTPTDGVLRPLDLPPNLSTVAETTFVRVAKANF